MSENDFAWMTRPRAFVRVYRLPEKLTNGYCFGGGIPVVGVGLRGFTIAHYDKIEHVQCIESAFARAAAIRATPPRGDTP